MSDDIIVSFSDMTMRFLKGGKKKYMYAYAGCERPNVSLVNGKLNGSHCHDADVKIDIASVPERDKFVQFQALSRLETTSRDIFQRFSSQKSTVSTIDLTQRGMCIPCIYNSVRSSNARFETLKA